MSSRQQEAIRLVLEISEREHGERLDKLIASRVTGMSRSFVQQLMKRGEILVNGQPCKPAQRVRFGDRLEVYLPPVEPPSDLEPEYLPIPVIYEDDDIIVFDKPPGIVTHPAPGHERGTLVNALKAIRPDLQVQPSHRPGIVHRLDKDTSGLLVVAKTEPARLALLEQWQSRSVVKRYTALVHGVVEPDSGTIDAPISRDPRDRTKMAVVAWGRPAITHFRVVERFSCATLLDVTIETGRTHQIRVHCAFIGHPVVGDQQYGGNRSFCVPVPRQFLHARYLRFRHPTTGQVIELETPLPWDLRAVLERLRALEREKLSCQARD
ncbi:MAG: RluA family pseudouridine synthase [Thermomicrobium sp.]|nr:RluA family pseudouridine synthase [Thermomicrobium sp.]MDW8006861.1 RluA family pseudouridine synthase [Thermomicrobium sp.]